MMTVNDAINGVKVIMEYCKQQEDCNGCKFYDVYLGDCGFTYLSEKYHDPTDWKKIGNVELSQ